VGFGGYPSLPSMKAAELLKIPYGLHEQNGVLGRSNRLLAASAAFTAHGFPRLERAPAKAKLIEVGNPIRDAVAALANASYSVSDGTIRLLIFGGSQGASLFSKVAPNAIAGLPENLRRRLAITHQVRDEDAASVKAVYENAGVAAELAPFFSDLPARIAASHLVIGRAGASTVTELAVIGRPSILTPLGIAMDDHQTGNARVLADAGAAVIIPEEDFTEETLKNALAPLLSESGALAGMAAKTRGRVKVGAAAALADLALELADRKAARKAA
ncbi:MAG: UDP-N-acetylglucosamine--N-acetylmuramyl-(pentapeptide) pyrophosphoryl-undecaprenol N-acetylglucosamine transferase, partial [Amphiplicatus sp.]